MSSWKTYIQIVDDVAEAYGDTTTSKKNKIKRAVNRAYAKAAQAYPWPQLIRIDDKGITITASADHFFLSDQMGALLGIFPSNEHLPLNPVGIASYLRRHGRMKDQGYDAWMISYTDEGTFGASAEISAAEKLTFTPQAPDSDPPGATISWTVHGMDQALERVETGTCLAGASAETDNEFTEIFSVATDGAQTAELFVSGSTSITVYARIVPGIRSPRYRKIRVGDTATEAKDLTLAYKKDILPLHQDDQVVEIPVGDALYHLALSEMYRQQRKPGPIAQSEKQEGVEALELAFNESVIQGESMEQAMPAPRYHGLPNMRSGK